MKKEVRYISYETPAVVVLTLTGDDLLASSTNGVDINEWENEDGTINLY